MTSVKLLNFLWSFLAGVGSNDWMVGGVLSWHHQTQSQGTIPQTSVTKVTFSLGRKRQSFSCRLIEQLFALPVFLSQLKLTYLVYLMDKISNKIVLPIIFEQIKDGLFYNYRSNYFVNQVHYFSFQIKQIHHLYLAVILCDLSLYPSTIFLLQPSRKDSAQVVMAVLYTLFLLVMFSKSLVSKHSSPAKYIDN